MVVVVDWSELQVELLMQIVENHLISVEDFIMFSCVCNSWSHAANSCDKSKLRQNWTRQMPWLMLTDGNDDEVYSDTGSYHYHMRRDARDIYVGQNEGFHLDFGEQDDNEVPRDEFDFFEDEAVQNNHEGVDYNFARENGDEVVEIDDFFSNDRNCYQRSLLNLSAYRNKRYNINIPEAYGKACWGSPYGWIVTLGLDRQMHLLNPLTRARLSLPSQGTFPYPWKEARDKTIRIFYFTKVVVLRVPPNKGTWLVVAFYHDFLLVAIAQPGDTEWTPIQWPTPEDMLPLNDVSYWDTMSSLIFVDPYGCFYCCDLHDIRQPQVIKFYFGGPEFDHFQCPTTYIVQSSRDDLLMIVRNRKFGRKVDEDNGDYIDLYKTVSFKVYKIDLFSQCWEELRDLRGVSLFVGDNATMAICAEEAGTKSNLICFCDDNRVSYCNTANKVGGHDVGVYCVDDGTIQPLYQDINSRSSYSCPFWLTPAE